MTISRRTYNILKWLLIVVAVFFMTAVIIIGGYYFFEKKYEGKFFPGTKVSGIVLDGLDRSIAEKKVNERVDAFLKNGIMVSYYDKKSIFNLLPNGNDAGVSPQAVDYDANKTLDEAYSFARTNSPYENFKKRMSLWNAGRNFDSNMSFREEVFVSFLNESFADFSTPAQNASLVIATSSKRQDIRFQVSEEVNGQVLNFDKAGSELQARLLRLDDSVLSLEMSPQFPTVFKKDCLDAENQARLALDLAPINLLFEKNKWTIEKNELTSLLELKTRNNENRNTEGYVGISFEKNALLLAEKVAKDIDRPVVDAKFEVVDGRVQKFQANQNGIELDKDDASKKLETLIITNKKEDVELVTRVVEAKEANEEMNNFGIKEILGTGHSNFSGSPKNRRHNIAVGAASVNGSLIAPGEEFSLLKALGKIDGSTGYLPELVIKEGKTLPEFGGGLCQIGTTVFRGTVQSGLPITMRRNHSYRVGYYEPAGTDATIYDPWPDYKFKNDTAHHVLIQSRFDGNHLYFDFWGTKDGREATSTYPTIYNIVKPAPTKMIETLDLKPGEKKCSETAHNGADAYFDYKVSYPDGKVDATRFKSHYVPWQAVCLLGVDKLTVDKEKEKAAAVSASSTTPAVKVEKK